MRDDGVLLVDIVEHARHVRTIMASTDRAQYDAQIVVRMGVARLLQIIGEAVRQLPEAARQRYPGVPWTEIVGMRHRLVHEYFRTDFDIVWVTAVRDVPKLLAVLEPAIGPLIDGANQE